jgi:hypothetical protein
VAKFYIRTLGLTTQQTPRQTCKIVQFPLHTKATGPRSPVIQKTTLWTQLPLRKSVYGHYFWTTFCTYFGLLVKIYSNLNSWKNFYVKIKTPQTLLQIILTHVSKKPLNFLKFLYFLYFLYPIPRFLHCLEYWKNLKKWKKNRWFFMNLRKKCRGKLNTAPT